MHLPNRIFAAVAFAAVALVGAACTVGPDYARPPAPVPATWKEQGWKVPQPAVAASDAPWWQVFGDPVLDDLLGRVAVSNESLKAQEAAYRQAQAVVAEARAGLFPTLDVSGSGQRAGSGRGSGGGGARTVSSGGRVQNTFDLTANATWTADLWGRVRRTIEADVAAAQVSAADLAALRLSLQAQLATDYFALRTADELKRLLDETADAYRRSLTIVRNQQRAGTATGADVANAETQLRSTEAQAVAVGVQRAQLEHAIATLVGRPASEFAIAPARLGDAIPEVPVGVPSTLLERRPDVAAAERQMASSNALIGVAEAANYPDLTLSASGGFTSTALQNLLSVSNGLWSIGASLAETVLDGGLREAQRRSAEASYQQSVASYRNTVLTAFQQVEDQLAALRILAEQAQVQAGAVASARDAERLTLNQYRAGTIAYTSVVVAQAAALQNAQTALNIRQSRLAATVALIQAVGGGWHAGDLPTPEAVKATR